MKVLIDTRSLQGAYHFGRLPEGEKDNEDKESIGKRLETFFVPEASHLQNTILKKTRTLLPVRINWTAGGEYPLL